MNANLFARLEARIADPNRIAIELPDGTPISYGALRARTARIANRLKANAMEIDSAQRHGAKAVFIVSNNAAWNIERLDQEMNYGGRVVGTTLAWSDYAGMARAFGLHAERVTDPARLEGAIRDALANAPALIDVVTTQHALSSDAGKGLGWVPDRQALTAWDDAEQERRKA